MFLYTIQSALHVTPWKTCPFQRQLNFFWKHSSTLLLQRLFVHISTRYLFLQLSELEQCRVKEIAQVSKWQQMDLKVGSFN